MADIHNIDPKLREYILSVSLRESDAMKSIREKTASHPCAKMQIPPEEAQLLALLVRISGAKRILEIGTFTGYSTLAMAEALSDDGKIVAVDKNEEWTSRAKRSWNDAGVQDKIDLRIGNGPDVLESLYAEKGEGYFDFVFIDADKKNYPVYLELALKCARKGALIAIDNTLWRTALSHDDMHYFNCDTLRAFNESLHKDERISSLSMLPVADGLTLAVKR
jgi:predicted O-methyltransferase YrrM